jgi:hypothetical protein
MSSPLNALLWGRMQLLRWRNWRPLVAAARHPRRTQNQWLQRHLARNADTSFGREHDFRTITSYEEFSERVPFQTYETLRPYIEEQEQSGEPVLNTDSPIMYAQTSGTTGKPKLIPILQSTLENHRRSQGSQVYVQFSTVPGAYSGRLLPIVSPAVEGTLPTGTPYGSASGHVYKNMPKLARAKYAVPPEVFEIEDYDLKYLTILRLAVPARDITFMASANPSTFLRLLDLLVERRLELLEDITSQGFRHLDQLPETIAEAVLPGLRTSEARVAELDAVLRLPAPAFKHVWPELRLVATWTGGSCRIALGKVTDAFPELTRIGELGYLSSEFRGTITVDLERNLGMPTIHENFIEFVERDDWGSGDRRAVTVERIEAGREYYVIVTTDSGLYRYFMNDLVEVTGRFHATPTVRFVQKGGGVTSITGEKLYENQVVEAVQVAQDELGQSTDFLLMLADPEERCYRLMIQLDLDRTAADLWSSSVERALGERNLEYAEKRKSGRLRGLQIIPVASGTGELYKRHMVSRGQREGQFKFVALQYANDCTFDFTPASPDPT